MLEISVLQFVLFVMIFLRISAMLVVAPLFGHQAVPLQVKVGISLFLAYVLFPLLSSYHQHIDVHYVALFLMALKEIILGVLVGFLLHLLFVGFRYAGELMAYTMGVSTAQMFDPENSQQTPVLGEFFYLFALLLFLVIDGHHFVLQSLFLLFKKVPVGEFVLAEPVMQSLISLTGLVFVVAVKIAAPVLIAGFLTYFGLSVLARVMPQANILVVGFPITITVGMLLLVASVPLTAVVFKKMLNVFETGITQLIGGF